MPEINTHPSFRLTPRTGVIYVVGCAGEKGFVYGHPDWVNLGQGAPETGEIPGSPSRLQNITLNPTNCEYGPVPGIGDLRDAVAQLYNARYRRGMQQYSAENVAISSGGRLGLTRVAAALGRINLGHFLPDYTAYEELLELFRAFVPIPILLRSADGFGFRKDDLYREIVGKGLGALLFSNPCNPTGQLLEGDGLAQWLSICRNVQCALIIDEFYSHYLYDDVAAENGTLSACRYVEDVEKESVVVIDGLTKNWRYPGLRLSWTIGPREIIRRIASAGSFLDGGPPHAIQQAALPLLASSFADQEAKAIQSHFAKKRALFLQRLPKMGLVLKSQPMGAFYCFVSLENMPPSLQNGLDFFQAALDQKVICVPGIFFDVNPGQRRSHIPSRLRGYVRLSFGPAYAELEKGLDRLEAMIAAAR